MTTAGAEPATSVADATARATALREQVDALEVRAALSHEDSLAASEELHRVISEELSAQSALDDAQVAGAEQRGQAARRARALYMSGGHGGMVASVLTSGSGDLGDILVGMRTVRTLVGRDAASTGTAQDSLDRAVAGSAQVQALRLDRQALEAESDQAAGELRAALDQQRALLAEADATVVALAEQQRADEERAAIALAAQRASASRSTPSPGAVHTYSAAAPTGAARQAIDAATTKLGIPYQWGAVGPDTFDCSGLTSWAYRQAGISIPRTSRAQYLGLPKVPLDQMAPGDLVFYASGSSPSSIHHVGIFLGDGLMLHAPRTGDVVKVSAMWQRELFGAVRPTG